MELLEQCLDRKAKRFYRPVPPTGDVLSTFADITAAKQANPTLTLTLTLTLTTRRFDGARSQVAHVILLRAASTGSDYRGAVLNALLLGTLCSLRL